MGEEFAFTVDRATAEDLYVALYELGEHQAAGAPITPLTADESKRLGAFLRELAHTLGRHCSPMCDHLKPR